MGERAGQSIAEQSVQSLLLPGGPADLARHPEPAGSFELPENFH